MQISEAIADTLRKNQVAHKKNKYPRLHQNTDFIIRSVQKATQMCKISENLKHDIFTYICFVVSLIFEDFIVYLVLVWKKQQPVFFLVCSPLFARSHPIPLTLAHVYFAFWFVFIVLYYYTCPSPHLHYFVLKMMLLFIS